jgi:hypothetical protein
MFYVYEHIRLDTNAVFYVGKGCGARVRSKDKRNKHWHSIVEKAGYIGQILVQDEDEELIFLVEQERIDQLKELGFKLANKTDGGGGGTKGYKHTPESCKKISEKLKGKLAGSKHPRFGLHGFDNPMFGMKQSASARHGMSVNCCMKRPEVVVKISGKNSLLAKSVEYQGKVYETMNNLATHLGISGQALRSRIFRGQSEKYGYRVLGHTQMLAKDFWTNEDLAPLQAASA